MWGDCVQNNVYIVDAVTREYESTEMMCIYGVPAKHKTCDLLQVKIKSLVRHLQCFMFVLRANIHARLRSTSLFIYLKLTAATS